MDRPPDRTNGGTTLHLVPSAVWATQLRNTAYEPETFSREGFVHCTDGEALVIDVANRYYRDDPRRYLVLDIDLARVQARAVYEDDAGQYPHVYGPIEREAVTRVRRAERTSDGTFTKIGDDVP